MTRGADGVYDFPTPPLDRTNTKWGAARRRPVGSRLGEVGRPVPPTLLRGIPLGPGSLGGWRVSVTTGDPRYYNAFSLSEL